MGVAAPIVGSIITSVIASKAVTMIGEKIGLDPKLTQLGSVIAGAYAGNMAYGEISAAQAAGTSLNPDAAAGVTEAARGVVDPTVSAPSDTLSLTGNPANIPSSPELAGIDQIGSEISGGITKSQPTTLGGDMIGTGETGGLLTQGQSSADVLSQGGAGADSLAKSQMVTTPQNTVGSEDSWLRKLFPNDRLVDMGVAGIGAWGDYETEMSKLDRQEDFIQDTRDTWDPAAEGGVKSIRSGIPQAPR